VSTINKNKISRLANISFFYLDFSKMVFFGVLAKDVSKNHVLGLKLVKSDRF
jgi:hypothetical protein